MSRLKRIVAELGGTLFDDGRRALIPGPGHGPSDRSVSLTECENGRILIYCFSPRDDWRAVRDHLVSRNLLNESGAGSAPLDAPLARHDAKMQSPERRLRAERLWNEARPICWTHAELYLQSRAIECSALNFEALRFHPHVTSLDDRRRRPALLAVLRDYNGRLQGVQATLLAQNGAEKARVATPRRVIGALMGGAVRLGAPDKTLVIAEGVETALSAANLLGYPAWAALTVGNLAHFEPPADLERLIIASDRDEAGHVAATRLAEHLHSKLDIEIAPPPIGHKDWNDVACSRL